MMNQEECGHLFCKCRTQRAALAHLTSHTVWSSCLFPGESGMRRLTHLHARSDLHHQASAWHFLRVHFFKKKKKKKALLSLCWRKVIGPLLQITQCCLSCKVSIYGFGGPLCCHSTSFPNHAVLFCQR